MPFMHVFTAIQLRLLNGFWYFSNFVAPSEHPSPEPQSWNRFKTGHVSFFNPGRAFATDPKSQVKSSYIRAAFSVAEDKDFDEGLRRVAELIREESGSKNWRRQPWLSKF